MTTAQKIPARTGGKDRVSVSEIVTARVDAAMAHDAMTLWRSGPCGTGKNHP